PLTYAADPFRTDTYGKGQPYAYFSSYGRDDGYNKYGTSDCACLGVEPYWFSFPESPNRRRYYASGFLCSHQVISAGADGIFGPGGRWEPKTAMPAAARDDQANFTRGELLATVPSPHSDPKSTLSTEKQK